MKQRAFFLDGSTGWLDSSPRWCRYFKDGEEYAQCICPPPWGHYCMRLQENVSRHRIQASNTATLQGYKSTKLSDTPYWPLLQCLAEIADLNAQAHNAYVTIGATKDQTALVFTATVDGAKGPVYAPDFAKLGLEAAALLDSA